MGKASSAKKIRRVQQAGVSRAPGQRRNLAFPALIIGIIVVGTVLTFVARESRQADASVAPVANRDHWHAAFGIDICGATEPSPSDQGPDRLGIHTHADGLIHVHPFGDGGAGDNATFAKFADQIGLQLGQDSITLPDGRTFTNGDKCPDSDETGRVALYVWPPQANENTDPRIVTRNLGDVRFTEDDQIFVLAFSPSDAEVELPASVDALANPIDEEPEPGSVNGSVPPTTEAGGDTATTVPGDATTTAPAGGGDGADAPTTTEPAG